MEKKENLEQFCNIIKARSNDHRKAIESVGRNIPVIFSILRQELDSMVRVIYLLTISDLQERSNLICLTLANKKWVRKTPKGKDRQITDKEMVEISNNLIGWSKSVYKFGCAFIHLSSFHNYERENPLEQIDQEERKNILNHMRQYHGGPSSDNPSLDELLFYLPDVFKKVSSNLEYYIEELEKNKILVSNEI